MDRQLEQLANPGEFLGGIAVITSLVYVAIQLRGNRHTQRSDSYGRSLDMLREFQSRFATNSEYAGVYNRGLSVWQTRGLQPDLWRTLRAPCRRGLVAGAARRLG